jgi:hypothetical protein
MGKQVGFLLLALIALIAALVLAERAFSPTFQHCITKIGTAETLSDFQATITSYVRCSARLIKVYEAAITALATIVIAAFTGTLWVATLTQARLTREAFIVDKRAAVFPIGIRPLYEPDLATGHFNWRIGPLWQNTGDTPTQGLRIYTDGFLSNVAISSTFDFAHTNPNLPPGTGMLGPKMISPGGMAPHMPAPGLTPQDILDIQNGRKFFYLWGWARYRDGLPETSEHISRYCWRIFVTGNPLTFNPLVNPNGVQFFNLYETRGNLRR